MKKIIFFGLVIFLFAFTFTSVNAETNYKKYVIPWGTTLSKIAQEFNVSVSEIADINNINDPGYIRAGDTLLIPEIPKQIAEVPKTESINQVVEVVVADREIIVTYSEGNRVIRKEKSQLPSTAKKNIVKPITPVDLPKFPDSRPVSFLAKKFILLVSFIPGFLLLFFLIVVMFWFSIQNQKYYLRISKVTSLASGSRPFSLGAPDSVLEECQKAWSFNLSEEEKNLLVEKIERIERIERIKKFWENIWETA